MSFLFILPGMFAMYFCARKLELPGSYFATVALLLTVILSSTGWVVPGADAVVALCLTMGLLNAATWYVDLQLSKDIQAGVVTLPPAAPVSLFCATQSHDFAVAPKETGFVIESINKKDWPAVIQLLAGFNAAERQGFYANLNYGSLSAEAVRDFTVVHPDNSDAHILYGHVKLCVAKEMGLVPGVMPDEHTAVAVARAFKHFRLALRLNAQDVEALCGLVMAKGFIALNSEHIEGTLEKLLTFDPRHFHGLISAARFLVRTPDSANRFIKIVERCAEQHQVTIAIARVMAHVECAEFSKGSETDSRVIADLYVQLKIFKQERQSLGHWQRCIASNVIAYAFEMIGDDAEKARQLSELNGGVSPYPWKRKHNDEVINGVMAG